MAERISILRDALLPHKLVGFILPVNDEFMGEYVPNCAKRLTWLTGFTGSAGMAVVLVSSDQHGGANATTPQGGAARSADGGSVSPHIKAAFFTDGRYTLQAEAEVKGFELYNSGDMSPAKWISENAPAGAAIGYDPKLHSLQAIRRYEKEATQVTFRPLTPNPIDDLWQGRPHAPVSAARIQQAEYAGETSAEKRTRIAKEIPADAVILTAPDSICWLLNLRGNDVPFTPFLLCYALLTKEGKVTLYLDSARVSSEVKAHLGDDVTLKAPAALEDDLAALSKLCVLYDPASSPVWFYQQLDQAGAIIVEGADPCILPKARKNKAELEGMRQAHIRDGLAVTKFLYWLDKADKKTLSEMSVAAKLESFRKESPLYLEPSFTTIAGSGPNGAIVHYRVTEETNLPLVNDSLLLLDSGGQYQDGTTDITRTVAIGNPSAEMKANFTRVLKGHIAIACAQFPEGTGGTQLDALARQYLWAAGLDYDHGTGHGVGSYLSVHEGPQRISKRGGDAPLEPGMVVSNEPGYYKAGEYGIRIESLVAVKEISANNGKRFLGFETITLAPIDLRLVDASLLTKQEADWLKAYHQKVYDTHSAKLTVEEAAWLKQQIA